MKSCSFVKTTRMYAPGFSTANKTNPWHTMSVTKKNKKLFGIIKKVYVSEYNSVFKKKNLYSFKNTKSHKYTISGLNEYKKSQMTHLLASNFWAFRQPMAVPGAIQMKRSKAQYKNYQKIFSNVLLWFGGMRRSTFLSLCKEAFHWNKLYHNTSFALFFDSLLPNLILKSGFAINVYSAKKSVNQQQANVVYNHRLQHWTTVNNTNMFFVNKHFFAKNHFTFLKSIYKKINNSQNEYYIFMI